MKVFRNEEEIKEVLKKEGYKYIDSHYIDTKHKKIILEDFNGYKYDVQLSSILSGAKISFVCKGNRFSIFNIQLWCSLENKSFELCEDNRYVNSFEKLSFRCLNPKCNEIFYMSWNSVYSGHGCSVCDGRQVGKYNNLNYLRPEIAAEWNYNLNTLKPENVVEFSTKKVYWKCSSCGYGENGEWFSSVFNRSKGTGCPACAGKVVSDKNRLSTLYPEIAAEWHPSKNKNLTSKDVSYGSGKRVWWLCPNGHEYFSSIAGRTLEGKACRKCKSSKGEKIISNILENMGVKNIEQYKFPDCKHVRPLPFDFYLPDYNICIEYHGRQHYEPVDFGGKGRDWAKKEFEKIIKKDFIKNKYCHKNNISLIVISYFKKDKIGDILNTILFKNKEKERNT